MTSVRFLHIVTLKTFKTTKKLTERKTRSKTTLKIESFETDVRISVKLIVHTRINKNDISVSRMLLICSNEGHYRPGISVRKCPLYKRISDIRMAWVRIFQIATFFSSASNGWPTVDELVVRGTLLWIIIIMQMSPKIVFKYFQIFFFCIWSDYGIGIRLYLDSLLIMIFDDLHLIWLWPNP